MKTVSMPKPKNEALTVRVDVSKLAYGHEMQVCLVARRRTIPAKTLYKRRSRTGRSFE